MKIHLVFLFLFCCFTSTIKAQETADIDLPSNIKTVKLFQQNNQESMPIINLNSDDLLEFHFDDFDNSSKNYYYTFQLCNEDWTEANVNQFDYIKGFTQNRISQYRQSSITLCKYFHYQILFPEKNCKPTKSGNYLLKIFLDGNSSNVVFTKRFYVVEQITGIGMQVLQPFDNTIVKTHHKINFTINTLKLDVFNPQQLHVKVIQNQRLDNLIADIKPTFIREGMFEFINDADCVFEAGKEHRWADLRSFRFESDRIARKVDTSNPIDVFMKPDGTRANGRYNYYNDYNGWYDISTTELVNNWWQVDYANVHFSYIPEKNQPYAGKDVFIMGEFTGNNTIENSKMVYNAATGIYEKTLLLKQGFYWYDYVTKDKKNKEAQASYTETEGNYWETENQYCVLVYYKSFSGRHDQLVGATCNNSRLGKLF
jgi:Domain of unknown function (DUF5103)